MALHSPLCDVLGIEVPIVLAGMGGASTPELAAAVSNAGGLGILGAAACSPEQLKEWIARTRKLTSKPFGVDTLLPASVRRTSAPGKSGGPSPMDHLADYVKFAREFMAKEGLEAPPAATTPSTTPSEGLAPRGARPLFSKDFFEAQMQVVIDEEVPVYAAGLGDPGPYIEKLHAAGTKVMAVVGAVRHARKVVDSGVDAIVAQGHDAGGHNSPVGTMALIPQVVDAAAASGVPVLAAGGIGDGRAIAASFMLGAQGVWVGTRFLATTEAGIADFQKQAIIESSEENTVVSKSVTGKPARLIRSRWTDAFAASGLEALPMPFQSIVSGPVLAAGMAARRKDIVPGFAGQIIGLIKDVKPAAEVMRDLIRETEAALRGAGRFV
jgi:NAD(P)H-dependent flavin oxidoreductase YrpB (nitropropane dioxygenase family)